MADPAARELIQRLADALTAHHQLPGKVPLLNEARAYLAAHPEPAAGPTDEERFEHWWYHEGSALPRPEDDWEEHTHRTSKIAWLNGAYCARYGNRTPVPIPLSERQPTEADCDDEGKCWLFGKVEGDWKRLNPHNSGVPKLSYCFSHWLPHYALPLPEGW